ncbi:MAG: hypothetical protein JW957_03170 [Candidatus Omnitrophica bacterium]|nr:hypothetical protein [Candidatus Omnitrophota bacterium]
MKIGRGMFLFCIFIFALSCSPVFTLEVSEGTDAFQIKTKNFEMSLAKTGVINSIKPASATKPFDTVISLNTVECGEQNQYSKTFARSPVIEVQRKLSAPAKYNIREKTETSAVFSFEWEDRLAKSTQVISVRDDSPLIDVSYTVTPKTRLAEVYVQLRSNGFGPSALFYPGGKRYGANEGWEYHSLAPGYIFAYDPSLKGGIGFIVDRPENLRSVGYLQRGKPEGFSGSFLSMGAYSRVLRWDGAGRPVSLSLKVVAGKPEDAASLAKKLLPAKEVITVEKVMPSKLIYWPDEEGEGTVALKNNSAEKAETDLIVQITGKIDEKEDILNEKVVLAPGEEKEIPVKWNNKGREYGYELSAQASKGGKASGAGREYFAVAEQFTKVGHPYVANPGWMNREGQEGYLIHNLRENYNGIVEYYCWMPDEIYDMTPDTEVFEPRTESQNAYRTTITRQFIKNMVSLAKKNGVRVVTLASGFASLPGAMQNPEEMKYTRDGQIYIWGSKLHGKDRFAVVSADVYSEESVRRWAQEMIASTDMFGWDGVRWDWNFVPAFPPDPLDVMRKDEVVWYNFEGVSTNELFKNPDQIAARLLKLWREEVNSKYPRFEYMTNAGYRYKLEDAFPKYLAEQSTKSGILFEFLLNYTSESQGLHTWDRWANELVDNTQVVRKNGAQPSVGWMSYAPGGITQRLIQFIAFASGVHWNGKIGPKNSIDDGWKRFAYSFRFSEYFYDPGFRKLSAGDVTVEGSDRILWKPFTYGRALENGKKEVTVHLINLPKSDYISMYHEIPEIKRNIKVSIKLGEGEKCTEVNALLPEPYPHKTELKFRNESGLAAIDVPELTDAAIIVAGIGGGK